jgi:LuxR family maltose regulon positive regulatory protein
MSDISQLLPSKLYAPVPHPDRVQRARLTARLAAGVRHGHSLLLCSAPAGYGKTTLLTSWLYEDTLPFTWLSLDQRDNDLRTFGRYLVAALQRLDATLGTTLHNQLAAPTLAAPEALALAFLGDLATLTQPVVLVLDDLQAVTAPEISAFLTALLEHPAPQLRLALSTRVDPPFPLARLRASGRLTEIRAADLRFTHDEAHMFFQQTMHVALSREAVHLLDTRTEGWIAGLQLAALSLQGLDEARIAAFVAAFRGSHHYVISYLGEEVLRLQAPEVREFLRRTVLLERFCAALCDAVTGRDDSRAMLERLNRANLFVVPLDPERVWYRYHHLFADMLRFELALDPAERAAVHLRAADWFAAAGQMRAAIDHALHAGAWERAAQRLPAVADEAITAFDYGLVLDWLATFPPDVLRSAPELLLLQALFAYLALPPDAGRTALAALDTIAPDQLTPRSWARLLHIRAVNAMLREAPESISLLQEALDRTGADDPFFRQRTIVALGRAYRLAGNTAAASDAFAEAVRLGVQLAGPANTLHATHLLALIYLDQGRRRETLALCAAPLPADPPANAHAPPTGNLLCVPLAICAYEADALDEAVELALHGRAEYRRYGLQKRGLIAADQILILAYAGRGEWEAAWRAFGELQREPTESRWITPLLALLAADLRLQSGEIAAAEQWLASVQTDGMPDEIREAHACTTARLLLAQGRPDAALQHLSGLDAQIRAAGRLARLITIHILQALAYAALAQTEPARTALSAAIGLAAPEGYVRRFRDEGPAVAPLLPLATATAPAFVAALQRICASAPPAHPPAIAAPLNLLTPQELAILRLLADGASYRAIAAHLVISVGTVRWHVHNIYGKLGVANRTQCLNRACELGFL